MNKTEFHPAGSFKFQVDQETQSRYWAVKSEKLMFTYFEVGPHKKFKSHSHESEQMTYVLEGKLFFQVETDTYCAGPGDLISIPSSKVHSVWTEAEGAKAVDAWSPVNSNL